MANLTASFKLTHSQCGAGNIIFCNFCCFRCASPWICR